MSPVNFPPFFRILFTAPEFFTGHILKPARLQYIEAFIHIDVFIVLEWAHDRSGL